MDGLRDHDESMLKAPANQDLRGRPMIPRHNFHDDAVRQAASPGEGPVCLELNFPFAAELEQLLLIQEGMELDLVHGRCDRPRRKHFRQMADRVVAHADRPSEAFYVELRERLPRLVAKARYRPVDQVQIDVVESQLAATPFERSQRGLVPVIAVPELRCDENPVPRNSTLPDCRADVPFVRVHFRGVDQAVPDLEGGGDGVPGLLARRGLPDAEAQDRHLVSVVQRRTRFDGEAHRRGDGGRPTSILTRRSPDFGMSFFGATNGFFTTLADRTPFVVDTPSRGPLFA